MSDSITDMRSYFKIITDNIYIYINLYNYDILKQDSEIQRYAVHHIHLLQRSFKSRQSQVNLDWLITKIRSTGLRIWLQRDPDHDYLWMVAKSYLGWLNHAKPLEIMGCLNHRFQLVQDFATIHRML